MGWFAEAAPIIAAVGAGVSATGVIPVRQQLEPFIIFALPRSRTAWLSEFLTYGKWFCRHEHAIRLRSIDDFKAALAQRYVGYAETAAGPAWYLISHFRPDVRAVVVRRPVEETIAAMIEAGRVAGISYDEHALTRVMTYGERCLERISKLPGTLTINHADLDQEKICRRVFEYCLPYRFDRDWWLSLRERNIQVNLREFFCSYQANREAIEAFKRECRR
jgi:hypothetical protein